MLALRLFVRSGYHFKSISLSPHRPVSPLLRGYSNLKMNGIKKRYDNIIKSAEDKRDYRGLELSNGIKIVLVSDPTSDKSAAAMCVNIGYLEDPEELPGLAHFCEHMLFLGTEKYPQENDYNKFLSDHGGSSNASTSPEHTCYYFDVPCEHFEQALDRFSQFFIKPLFNEDSADREVTAVDSEHDKNRQSDAWRFDQLEKSFAKEGHRYRKFGTGNKQTLDTIPKQNNISVRDALLDFHKKWYSANIMNLAIVGKESLDELEELSLKLFSEVENKNVKLEISNDHPYTSSTVQVKEYVVPIKDMRHLAISFPIPDYREHYKASPGQYLAHLIGHEGDGSILSALRAKGWCNNLVGGNRNEIKGFDQFLISVDLTEEGIDHVDDIVLLIFQYIKMLNADEPPEWVFKEQEKLLEMHFRFKDKPSPTTLANSISQKLDRYPIEEVLVGGYLLTDWKPDLIKEILSYLTPSNVRVSVAGKKFAEIVDQKEKWYGTEYKLEKIPEDLIKEWENCNLNPDLHLPEKNEFIPYNFQLSQQEENSGPHPTVLMKNDYCRIWYKQDDEFLLPKANVRFEIVSPLAYLDPLNCNMSYMFVSLFKDALLEYTYPAGLAGLKWELSSTKYGMILGINGYNDKQKVLLDKIINKMVDFKVDPKRFEIIKESDHIDKMSDDEFNNHKEALTAQKLEKPKQMLTQSAKYWAEITNHQYNFGRSEIEVEFLKNISKEDILDFYDDVISENASHRHKIAVHVISTAEGGAGCANGINNEIEDTGKMPKIIDDVVSFKASCGLYPLVEPFVDLNLKSKL